MVDTGLRIILWMAAGDMTTAGLPGIAKRVTSMGWPLNLNGASNFEKKDESS